MDFLQNFFKHSDNGSRFTKPKAVDESQQRLIYRDELSKKKQTAPKEKKRVRFDESKADQKIVDNSDKGEKSCIKVKVLMTKEEAARLLSKCKDGGNSIGFKDVANELFQIPNSRVVFVSSGTGKDD